MEDSEVRQLYELQQARPFVLVSKRTGRVMKVQRDYDGRCHVWLSNHNCTVRKKYDTSHVVRAFDLVAVSRKLLAQLAFAIVFACGCWVIICDNGRVMLYSSG
jgi:hypothetical protein